MNLVEARKIYEDWKNFIEIQDKLFKIFHQIPESFLPYPLEILEEALNIVAKEFFDVGDKETSHNIQRLMGLYSGFYLSSDNGVDKISDEKVLESMRKNLEFIMQDDKLRKAIIQNLKECSESWLEINKKKNNLNF